MDEHTRIRAAIAAIPDPEIPVVTISDLGILQSAEPLPNGDWLVKITPTYSGCPAMREIEKSVFDTLQALGVNAQVELVLEPAWTTDWITEEGRKRLKAYGIAPPQRSTLARSAGHTVTLGKPTPHGQANPVPTGTLAVPLFEETVVNCPRCDSRRTRCLSAFGATACKEQWSCDACSEPFEHFKCH